MKPSVLLERLDGEDLVESVARVEVNLASISVETHCIILATLPAARRRETMTALRDSPIVVSCDEFESEPRDILLEVAAGNGHKIQDLISWAHGLFGLKVHDVLPIEQVLRGGPEQPPNLAG